MGSYCSRSSAFIKRRDAFLANFCDRYPIKPDFRVNYGMRDMQAAALWLDIPSDRGDDVCSPRCAGLCAITHRLFCSA